MDITTFFNTYSLSDIFLFLALLASAVMGVGRFIEWFWGNVRKPFDKERRTAEKEQELKDKIDDIEKRLKDAEDERDRILSSIDFFSDKLEILIDSDKDSIKAYLTDKHHYYIYTQGWIDDYNLDCIERRYVHYKKSGGNSFVDHLMDELRALPHRPPKDKEIKEG